MKKKLILLIIVLLAIMPIYAQQKILWDNTKSEEAGNADWIIDDTEPNPYPAQSGITSSTTEDYWTGGLSAWGVEMVKRGYTVETLTSSNGITYNNSSNSQDLSNYDVFIVCEPNNRFSTSEKQAIMDFVQNGGGLFIISDHDQSDRDNDGWDSPHIWNDLFSDYSNPFGITFDYVNITDAPTTNVVNDASDPILHGPAGDVTSMEFHGSATLTMDPSANSSVKGVVYKSGATLGGNNDVMLAYGTYGNGRFAALVDSSPADDGTGQSGNTLYDGWDQYDNQGTNGIAITNATIWLAGSSSAGPTLTANPNSLSGFSYVVGNGPSSDKTFDLTGSNLDGSDVTLTAPGDYEISLDGTSYSGSITLGSYDGTSTTIHVRLKAGLSVGTYDNENITISGGGANDITVALSGQVTSDAGGCASDLIISEYGEGSTGNSKYIEIYNGTGADVDLSGYQLWRISNGGSWPEDTYDFSTTTLADGSTIVVANNSTDVPGADEYDAGFCAWNGDDAVGLAKDDGTGTFNLIDAIGTDGSDPGSGWDVAGITDATKDHYLVRKADVTSPTTDWSASAGTNSSDSQWEVYDYSTGAAQDGHTMNCSSGTLTADPNSLSGFSYVVGNGPSSSQTFDLTGSDLDGSDVTLNAPSDYEISLDGTSFSGTITLSAYDGSLTTIYVRLKAGLAVGTYNNEAITISGGGASDITVTLNGEVVEPTLTADPNSLSGFSYVVGNGPSSSQTFDLTGSNLDGSDVTLSAQADYEISLDGTSFSGSITLSAYDGSSKTIYVRLKASLAVGTYNNETITISGGGASDITVTLNGEVVEPTLTADPNSLSGFSYVVGNGPSSSQTFDLTGSNLDGSDVTLTAPADYEISLDGTSFSGSITLSAYDGSSKTIYVRLKEALTVGTYNNETITISGGGASDITVTLNGEVTEAGSACTSDLIISEYGEGSTGNSKYIEIYNGTGSDVDLSGYQLWRISNGGSWPEDTYDFSTTTLADGSTIVVANNSTDVPGADEYDAGFCAWNGDDAVGLAKDDGTGTFNLIDAIGTDGSDPGSGWDVAGITDATKDHYLIRKPDVTSPTTDWSASAGTNSSDSQWEVYDYDTGSAQAGHTINCTCDTPTTEATNLVFSNITSSSIDLSWTNGDGAYRIVIAKESAPVDKMPIDSTTYTANTTFGSGDDLGDGNYVVYNGSGSSVSVTGLQAGTTYYFRIIEYNCSPGSEHYLTQGTPLNGDTTTLPNDVSNFTLSCATTNSADVSWSLPTGSYDGILITALQGGTPVAPDCDGNFLNSPNPDYSSASAYCGNATTDGVYLFNDIGTTLSITGLTAGQSYTLTAYVYKNSSWSAGQSITFTAELSEVSNFTASCANNESVLNWTNPNASCFDEVMIVAKDGSTVTATPSGDGSAYTANSAFGSGTQIETDEYVVYKGTGEDVTVTNLNNGDTYYFKIFVRKGTDWSTGVEVSCTPQVIFDYNDIAIIGVNTHIIEYDQNISDDEIQFVCFKDIPTGTSIDFTDNGYEHTYAGYWGTTEGTLRFTRTGSDLAAGQIIVIRGKNSNGSPQIGTDFHVYLCNGASMTNDDANWTVQSLNGNGPYDLNVDDQIWMMQGGDWNVLASNKAEYTGKVEYGWTATGWETAPGYDDTKGSTKYPGTECSNTDVSGVANHDKVKYTGPTDATSQLGWIGRFNDAGNWTGYADSASYVNGGSLGCSITITDDPFTAQWTGASSTDWDDCANWMNLRVPDASTDVSFVSDDCSNDIVIKPGQKVECHSLTISGSSLVHSIKVEGDSSKAVTVHGDLNINIADALDFDDGDNTTDDGQLIIYGNWNNNVGNAGFYEGNSYVTFKGSTQQTITTSGTREDFANLFIENSSPLGVTLVSNIKVKGKLDITNSIIDLNENDLNLFGPYTQINGFFKGNSSSVLRIDSTGSLADIDFIDPQNLDSLVMNRNETANIVSSLDMADLKIIAGSVTLAPAKFYTVTDKIENNVGASGLILKSDASGTASLIHYTENVPATCQRFIQGGVWAYVFSPLSAVPTSILTSGGVNPNFYWYDESTADYWKDYDIYGTMGWTSESSTTLSTDKGYILQYNENKTYELAGGNLYFDATSGNKVFTLSYTDVGSGPVNQNGVTDDWDDFEGWNLIGNPFTSAIDWDQVTLNNVEDVVYYWDGGSQNYKYYSGGGTVYNQGLTVNGGSQYVPANQAFFVKATVDGGTVTIPNSARVHSSQAFWKSHKQLPENFVKLRISSGKYYDETAVVLDSNATSRHDNNDAYKFFSFNRSVPQIYTIDNGQSRYAINHLPQENTYVVPVGLHTLNAGTYTIVASDLNTNKYHIYLKDKQTNQMTNLVAKPAYTFNYDGGGNDERFELVFNENRPPVSILPIGNKYETAGQQFSFNIDKNCFVDPDMGDYLTITATMSDGSDLPEWLHFKDGEFSGIYDGNIELKIKVTATDMFGSSVSQTFNLFVVEEASNLTDNSNGLLIYPNPADKNITITIPNILPQTTVEIYDASGKLVKELHTSEQQTNVDVSNLRQGMYLIKVANDVVNYEEKLIIR